MGRNRRNRTKEKNGEDFLNPYNFVSSLEVIPRENYQSHRDNEGLSGKIKCKLEVLNKLFIPDSNNNQEFYKNDKGEVTIPASSLKGMLRVTTEAIANACFPIVDEERYSYRPGFSVVNKMEVGRITKMPTENQAGEIEKLKKASINYNKHKLRGRKNLSTVYIKVVKGKRNKMVVDDIVDGLNEKEKQEIEGLGYIKKQGDKIYKGYLYKRDERYGGFYNKENEKVFYQDEPQAELEKIEFSKELMDDYNYIVKQKCKDTFKSNNYENKHKKYKLNQNESNRLLYFKRDRDKEIEFVSDTEVPKFRYKNSPAELIENQGLAACDKIDELCYGCRLFGMIAKEESDVSYKGRLKFNDAKNLNKKVGPYKKTHGAVGGPKPQQAKFYLENKKDYNSSNARIRGRKFYFHGQPRLNPVGRNEVIDNDEMGPKAFKPLEEGSSFEFEIEFDRLSEKELGLLLYAIELEEGLAHKLGLAKGYGMGSIDLKVEKLELEDKKKKYQSFGYQAEEEQNINDYIQTFKQEFYSEISNGYEKEEFKLNADSFDELLNIKHIKVMFRTDLGKFEGKVYYPNKDNKSFEWFGNNKKQDLVYPEQIDFERGKRIKLDRKLRKNKKGKKRKSKRKRKKVEQKKKNKTKTKKEENLNHKYDKLLSYVKGEHGAKVARRLGQKMRKQGKNNQMYKDYKEKFEYFKRKERLESRRNQSESSDKNETQTLENNNPEVNIEENDSESNTINNYVEEDNFEYTYDNLLSYVKGEHSASVARRLARKIQNSGRNSQMYRNYKEKFESFKRKEELAQKNKNEEG